tara:strand:- start:1713 stop:2474 length:762 start_codon:yes stop_codon:yes gene_type:complete
MQEESKDSKDDYLNNVRRFYSLKKNYEQTKENYKKKLHKSQNSIETKKKLLSKHNFKCVNCGNDGGTIFLETSDFLKASCGNISNPCDLKIDIKKNKKENLLDKLDLLDKDLQETKRKITLTKLDYLFKYIEEDNAVEKFEELKNELSINQESYNKMLEYYYDITNNAEKNQLLNGKLEEFYNVVSQYKEFIQLFKDIKDKKYLKDAIQLYIEKIIDLNKKLMELKYKINLVETDEDTYILFQKKYDLHEFNI